MNADGGEKKISNKKRSNVFQKFSLNAQTFLIIFFQKSGIHGFFYFAQTLLHILEKLFWFILIVTAFCSCCLLSYQSYKRYETKSTVITIEKDHYYWNTSLPSITICPAVNRIDRYKLTEYCENRNIHGEKCDEFYLFMESLANSSYVNFEDIPDFKSIEDLNIDPADYMFLIYSLSEDWSRREGGENKVRSIRNLEFLECEQVLTEYGICYTTNNYLSFNLSTTMLILGIAPVPQIDDFYYRESKLHKVIAGNLFDGDLAYSFIGFTDELMIFLHSPFDTINISRNNHFSKFAIQYHCFANEIVVDDEFQEETTIKQRGCRFLYESNLTHYEIYTNGLCTQECRLNLAYELCKCIPHFYPNRVTQPKKVCHYKELKGCISKNKDLLLKLRDDKNGKIPCYCLPNCVDTKIFVDNFQMLETTTEFLTTIGALMTVKQYPLIRYKRKILFTIEDLYVSIGGTAGLFTGFSVLGAFEIVYFFTLRLFWYIKGRR